MTFNKQKYNKEPFCDLGCPVQIYRFVASVVQYKAQRSSCVQQDLTTVNLWSEILP